MRTHEGNAAATVADIGEVRTLATPPPRPTVTCLTATFPIWQVTMRTLRELRIPYHELAFGAVRARTRARTRRTPPTALARRISPVGPIASNAAPSSVPGKPYAHYYVDDLAVSAFRDLHKELGFYPASPTCTQPTAAAPRRGPPPTATLAAPPAEHAPPPPRPLLQLLLATGLGAGIGMIVGMRMRK